MLREILNPKEDPIRIEGKHILGGVVFFLATLAIALSYL